MDKEIFFNKKDHIYTTKDGTRLISASQIIEKYHEPFDDDGSILENCARKEGVSKEVLKARWDSIRDNAAEFGTSVHNDLEYYIINGRIAKNSLNADIVRKFAKIYFEGKLFPEQILYSLKFGIAGTTDLIEFIDDKTVNIYDFKTNKALRKFAFGKKKMLYPVNRFPDCNFYHYTLQLSLYGIMLEEWGCKVNKLRIFYINPQKDIEVHPIEYVRKDVLNMLRHYKDPKKYEDDKLDF